MQLRSDTYKKDRGRSCENSLVPELWVARAVVRETPFGHKKHHTHPPNPHFLVTPERGDDESIALVLV